MPVFKNYRGQLHMTNTVLVALASLYVVGASVALSSPYWASSSLTLAPLEAFAATPLGIGILAAVTVALIGLVIYAIDKNNEISKEKALKITQDGLLLRRDIYEGIKGNRQQNDEKQDQHHLGFLCFRFGSKEYYANVGDKSPKELDNTLFFKIDSLKVKDNSGKYVIANDNLPEEPSLNKDDAKEVNTCLNNFVSVAPVSALQQRN